jgi:hyperosmotically inducible periplasmic protein
MNITLRILSPAIVSACLVLPMLAEHDKADPATTPRASVPVQTLPGEPMRTMPLGHVARVSDIIGLEVRNLQDEKLGKVNDLGLDLDSGRIVGVIVSTGGVLGVGTSLFAVPPSAFHYDHAAKVLHLDRTKESLKSLPPFDVAQWDTHFQATNVVEVYREYGVQPYFDANAVAADNTALNRRDRDGSTLTPGDQGGSATDVAITARIRKAVLAKEGLSVNAQNVKIITVNGRVTLRGPVNTEAEKRAIGEIAEHAVAPASVDNQLEVKREVSRN